MVRQWNQLRLWTNQRAALKHCSKYLATPSRAALVHMPTGSGKTGVISVLSRIHSEGGIVLVTSPSKALVEQLQSDIGERFWANIGASAWWRPHAVRHLLPSEFRKNRELIDELGGKRVILVGTLVSLLEMEQSFPDDYLHLRRKLALVIVDEGHREPAVRWANAVRGLKKPTILFSATPYRNDYKHFDVDEEWVFFYSFEKALNENLVRDVEFEELASDGSASDFATRLLRRREQLVRVGRLGSKERVIVRCDSEASVRAVGMALVQSLGNRKMDVLAVHDRFVGSNGPFVSHIKDLRKTTETFLVHQYKLMEGIDDPRCSALAIFEPFSNDRQLVQQIGRVIRHPEATVRNARAAIVLGDRVANYESTWQAFRRYDRSAEGSGGRPRIRNYSDTASRMLREYPEIDYQQGRFCEVAKPDSLTLLDNLRLPRSCVAYSMTRAQTVNEVADLILAQIQKDDRELQLSAPIGAGQGHVYVSLAVDPSPLVHPALFPLLTLVVTVVVVLDKYLLLYDSKGLYVDDALDCERLDAAAMYGLIPNDPATKVTSISLVNGDLGPFAVRSRTMGAASLAESVPFMGDNTNVVTRATGRVSAVGRRYVGVRRARVRDGEGNNCSLDEYLDWARRLVRNFQAVREPIDFLDRFAIPVAAPVAPEPSSILLEASVIESGFVGPGGVTIEVTDACVDVRDEPCAVAPEYRWAFAVGINGTPAEAWAAWDTDRRKFRLFSPDMDQYVDIENSRRSLAAFLTQSQAFRLTLRGTQSIYAAGQFYDTRIQGVRAGAGRLLLDLLTGIEQLGRISTEKGSGTAGTTAHEWGHDSLFHFIDSEMVTPTTGEFGRQFSHVVCDDMGSESADFIGIADNGSFVAFVQAKCKSTPAQVSSSALYDVYGQATKNLAFLRYGATVREGRARLWNSNWKGGYQVRPRIRRGPTSARDFAADLSTALSKPGTRREMWLVLGQTLSKASLTRDLQLRNPPAHAIQTFYLLMAAHNSCKSVGVDLRIFCSP